MLVREWGKGGHRTSARLRKAVDGPHLHTHDAAQYSAQREPAWGATRLAPPLPMWLLAPHA